MAWSSPSVVHDNRLLTFRVDTSPSVFSKPNDPIVRINPSPPPGHPSSKMHFHADDPAFSTDPRLNPHHVPQDTGPPPYTSIEDATDPDLNSRTRTSPPAVTPPDTSNDPPLQPKHQQPVPEAPPSDDSKQRRRSRPSPNHSLDNIDELDESDPFGRHFHHGGPYQTANEALKFQRRSPPRMGNAPESGIGSESRHLQRLPHQPPIPTGKSLNLVPGQIMPRMPYQPPPPANYISPEPRFGSPNLYPDAYPFDAPPFPQPPPQGPMRMPSRFSAPPPPINSNWNPEFPIPEHPDLRRQYSNSHYRNMIPHSIPQQSMPQYSNPYPPSSNPFQRHSLPTEARPPPTSPIYDPYHSNIRHAPSLSHKNVPPPLPDIPLPPQPVQNQPATKPAPTHVPKRLVMPTPLQQQQQQQPIGMSNYPPQASRDIHASLRRDDSLFGNRDGINNSYVNLYENGRVQQQAMPQAHAPPMIHGDRNSRHLLRKRSTIVGSMHAPPPVDGIKYSKSMSNKVPNETQGKVKEKSGGLFRIGSKVKPTEKVKPMEKEKPKEKDKVLPKLVRKLSKRNF